MSKRNVLVAFVFSLLLGLSPLAADPVIQRGIDVFTTLADGRTYYDFAKNPIPAGFFCADSKAFTGRVAFKGLPLVTETPGQLWGGDTVIERLDNATFTKGTAVTRMRFRALSLTSIEPIRTSCGAFHVYVSLNGPQRVTMMSIHRTQESGGSFVAPLAVNARLTFIPVKPERNKAARKLELTDSFTFPPGRPLPWSLTTSQMTKRSGPVVVDTNGDLTPDTLLPGTSNFAPGRSPDNLKWEPIGGCCASCHDADGEEHCYYPSNCYPIVCPY